MGLFEQFPYTNFHELNLDWLIEQLNIIKESTVLSVNGETGDVILYKEPLVRLPDITDDTWNIFRYADGTPVGIQFKKGSPLQRIDNLGRYDIYDANNPPPYPVTAVNGQTGDVVISIPVQSVNGMTGNIILYQQASVELPALESGDTWRLWRETETNAEVGIKFTSGQPMKRVDDGNDYAVYDEGNTPPYPVTSVAGLQGAVAFLNTQIVTDQGTQKVKILFPVESVDGLTGTVRTWANSANETLKTPTASEGDRWALARECPSGDVGIRFTYSSNDGVQGYLVFSDGQNPETALRILTPADIPSSSGVVSINGLSGVVVLYAADLQMSNGDSTTIPQAINNKAPIESLAIPIVGNVASVNVPAGSFVYVKNSTITGITDGLYIAVNAISANTAFTAADLDNTNTAVGGLNAVNSKITTMQYTVTSDNNDVTIVSSSCYRVGKILKVYAEIQTTAQISKYGTLIKLESGDSSISQDRFALLNGLDVSSYTAYIEGYGSTFRAGTILPSGLTLIISAVIILR